MMKNHTNIRQAFLLSTALTLAGLLLPNAAAEAKHASKKNYKDIYMIDADTITKCQNPEPFPEPFPEAFPEPFPEPSPEPFPEQAPCPDILSTNGYFNF